MDLAEVINRYDKERIGHAQWFATQLDQFGWAGGSPRGMTDDRGSRIPQLPAVINPLPTPDTSLVNFPRGTYQVDRSVAVRSVDPAAVLAGNSEALGLIDEASIERIAENLGRGAVGRPETLWDGGWDWWAWYQPILYFGPNCGIYIRRQGLTEMASAISPYVVEHAGTRGAARLGRELVLISFALLFFHEAYHHQVEAWSWRAAVLFGDLEVPFPLVRYGYYSQYVYQSTYLREKNVEEGLATAATFRASLDPIHWFRKLGMTLRQEDYFDLFEAARRWMFEQVPHQPPGYSSGIGLAAHGAFRGGEELLAAEWRSAPMLALIQESNVVGLRVEDMLPSPRSLFARMDSASMHTVSPAYPPPSRPGMQPAGKGRLPQPDLRQLVADAAPEPAPEPPPSKKQLATHNRINRRRYDQVLDAAATMQSEALAWVVGTADEVSGATEVGDSRPSNTSPIFDFANRTFLILD